MMIRRPRPSRRPCRPTGVIGHRGTRDAAAANNTLAAFAAAVADGVNVLELDIRRTKPNREGHGTWVVFHDANIDGRAIATTPYATLKRLRPDLATFRQAMVYVASTDRAVQVEVKPTTVAAGSLRYFARTATTLTIADRFELDSSHAKVLSTFRKLGTGLPTGYIRRSYVTPKTAKKVATTVLLKRTIATAEWVAALHRAGLGVEVWTVDSADDWSTFTGYGVDGLVTDEAAALVAWCSVPS